MVGNAARHIGMQAHTRRLFEFAIRSPVRGPRAAAGICCGRIILSCAACRWMICADTKSVDCPRPATTMPAATVTALAGALPGSQRDECREEQECN